MEADESNPIINTLASSDIPEGSSLPESKKPRLDEATRILIEDLNARIDQAEAQLKLKEETHKTN